MTTSQDAEPAGEKPDAHTLAQQFIYGEHNSFSRLAVLLSEDEADDLVRSTGETILLLDPDNEMAKLAAEYGRWCHFMNT